MCNYKQTLLFNDKLLRIHQLNYMNTFETFMGINIQYIDQVPISSSEIELKSDIQMRIKRYEYIIIIY